MTTIAIVEGNTPDLVAAAQARGETGLAEQFARELRAISPSLSLVCVAPYDGQALPTEAVDAYVFTGSGVEWNTADCRAAPLQAAMETALATGRPVWGSCNGMQLAATVLGGAVAASPRGFEDGLALGIRPTEAGRDHPMLDGRGPEFAAPCVHRDEVTGLPPGAALLASNAHCQVQAFAVTAGGVDFWGTQYHPEYPPALVAAGLERYRRGTEGLADLLRRVESDPKAALGLGARAEDLRPDARRTELRNWLAHVAGGTTRQ